MALFLPFECMQTKNQNARLYFLLTVSYIAAEAADLSGACGRMIGHG
jgi:hypothetical protein